jgi:hypothetical protein
MTRPDYIQVIPLAVATFCETCQCITESKGERCDYCQAPTLTRLQALLEPPPLPKVVTGIEREEAREMFEELGERARLEAQ